MHCGLGFSSPSRSINKLRPIGIRAQGGNGTGWRCIGMQRDAADIRQLPTVGSITPYYLLPWPCWHCPASPACSLTLKSCRLTVSWLPSKCHMSRSSSPYFPSYLSHRSPALTPLTDSLPSLIPQKQPGWWSKKRSTLLVLPTSHTHKRLTPAP